VTLPEAVWGRLLASWIVFFVLMGALNIIVAYNFSTDAWVNFKLFGGIGLMLVFIVLQGLMLARHIEDKKAD
jgi:intracellular septation protein